MTTLTREEVQRHLERTIADETQYLKAHKIAVELNTSPKAVVQYLRQLQDCTTDITLEKWAVRRAALGESQ